MAIDGPNDPWADWEPPRDSSGAPTGDPWTPEEDAAAQQWADNYITQHQIPVGYGNRDDLINSYRAQRGKGLTHDQAMTQVPVMLGWDKYSVGGGGGGGNGGGGGGGYPPGTLPPGVFDPYPDFVGPKGTAGNAPTFHYDPYKLPDEQAVLADKGYQFRAGQGRQQLEQSAAAKGLLRTGGTLKDILGYGQSLASQEYKNVNDRMFETWKANGVNAAAEFAPKMHAWDVANANDQLAWDNAWKAYQTNWATWKNNHEWPYYVLTNERSHGAATI